MIKSAMIQWQLNSSISNSCDFSREVMPKISVSLEFYSHVYNHNQECDYDYKSKKINI